MRVDCRFLSVLVLTAFTVCSCEKSKDKEQVKMNEEIVEKQYPSVSGIYPHLASFNAEGECGTGAVVPWANRLWVMTYAPHKPFGSSDKLYEIDVDMNMVVRPESIGGTPANRLIHKESEQLFMGPYAIDATGKVRTIPYEQMQGRLTGSARHLTDPTGKIYTGTMEEGIYEIDVKDLGVNAVFKDANKKGGGLLPEGENGPEYADLKGAHGKGLYSGQGVLVFSNNGENNHLSEKKFDIESGSLNEWDGKEWKQVRRNQFTEVTGPGGIEGNVDPAKDPIWTTGWDHKSLLLGVREPEKGWSFYRLPKASNSYDGAHGWNTEWPRIRNIGTETRPDYLMTMHGLFWKFPEGFTSENSAGIRPHSAYLKVIGDFAFWKGNIVFGCDNSAQKEFLNKRKVKGSLEGPGQSNSNLWFTFKENLSKLGPNTAQGAVWLDETVPAMGVSEPFLFNGWDFRSVMMQNHSKHPVTLTIQVDKMGNNKWTDLKKITLKPGKSEWIEFTRDESGEWVRIQSQEEAQLSVAFNYNQEERRSTKPNAMFEGLAEVSSQNPSVGGLLYGLGRDRRNMGVVSLLGGEKGGYYELDETLTLTPKEDPETVAFIEEKCAIPKDSVVVDESAVLIVDDQGRRWKLPKGNPAFTEKEKKGEIRLCREVATERDLFQVQGTFFELPAENADGFAKIRPIATHPYKINDYASYRGMLVMTGIEPDKAKGNPHVITSADQKAAVWVGDIDDLWKLGKPTGEGSPWKKDQYVQEGEVSDPFLIGNYDKKTLTLSHKNEHDMSVTFTLEVDPIGNGTWIPYKDIRVMPGETETYVFPDGFSARWIRLKTNRKAPVSAWFKFE